MARDFPASAASAHRDDIDGLRAIAVGLVIAFHFGVPGISGGFVGVDIFFVISGFLIGGIIERELGEGRFSIVAFYERRVRRIFPALFAMLGACAIAAAIVLFPADLMRFAKSAAATALFWSNIHFNGEAGYWDVAAHTKPLLHTWSLAVEEQFYLVFPLILFALRRRARATKLAALGGMALLSFAASVWAVQATPTAAFYLAPYRFWEFLIGAILAIIPQLSSPASRAERGEGRGPRYRHADHAEDRARSSLLSRLFGRRPLGPLPLSRCAASAGDDNFVCGIAALMGLAMILYPALTLPRGGAFPGMAALMPCLGAGLLIFAGQAPNAVSRALSVRPIVFLGLISYSLYLWHWPVWVFAHVILMRPPTPLEAAFCAALTLALAVLSWRFVEQPFRRKPAAARRPILFGAGAVMATVCLAAFGVVAADGLPQRFGSHVAKIVAQQSPHAVPRCFGVAPKDVSADRLCGIGAGAKTAATFILWGDSHAEAILPAVERIARRHNRRGLFAGSPSCAPLIGVERYDAPDCKAFNDRVLAMLAAHKEIVTVILMARWGKNAAGTAYGEEGSGFVAIGDAQGRAQKPSDNAPIFARGLDRTVAALRAAGKQVLLVGPVPEIGWTVPEVLARLELEHKDAAPPPDSAFYAREAAVLPLFRRMAQKHGVSAVFPHRYLCRDGICAVKQDGIPLYRDAHHLSDYGAKSLEPLLSRAIDPLFDRVS